MKGFFALLFFLNLIAGLQLWPVAAAGPHCIRCDIETTADRYKAAAGHCGVSAGLRKDGPTRRPTIDRPQRRRLRLRADHAVYRDADKTAAGKTLNPRHAVHNRGQSWTALNKIEKLIFAAIDTFFDKMKMVGHMIAFKLKFVFKTFIIPLI